MYTSAIWDMLQSIAMVFLMGGIGSLIQKYWPHLALGETPKQQEDKEKAKLVDETVEQTIIRVAKEECVDPVLAVKVAQCESALNPKAILVNENGTRDRGIYQINDKWHPEVTDEQAFNPEFSAHFFCKAFKNGNLSWWDASKTCWSKQGVV